MSLLVLLSKTERGEREREREREGRREGRRERDRCVCVCVCVCVRFPLLLTTCGRRAGLMDSAANPD